MTHVSISDTLREIAGVKQANMMKTQTVGKKEEQTQQKKRGADRKQLLMSAGNKTFNSAV